MMYSPHTLVQKLQSMNACTTATTRETLQQCKNIPEGSSISLMERRQDKQTPLNYNAFSAAQNFLGGSSNADEEDLDGLIAQAMKLEPVLESCCDDFGSIIGGDFWGNYGNILSGLVTNSSNATTLSCPQPVSVATNKGKEIIQSSNLKKRKAEQNLTLKEAKEDGNKDKKLKGCTEVRSSMSKEQNNTTKNSTTSYENKETSDTSKEKSKTSQVEKPDYIHVRARRGEATDSHSLAERVRREKISERMKYLQNLVPGCNNISGKAGMLDEIINYVQALQRQVEFLSMKLAAVYPQPDFNDDSYYTKEVFPASTSDFHHPVEALPDICLPQNYQSDVLQQAASSNGLEIGVAALKRTISAPVSIPGTIFESPCFNHLQSCSPLDAELQGIFGLELQQITGFSVGGHVRMEM